HQRGLPGRDRLLVGFQDVTSLVGVGLTRRVVALHRITVHRITVHRLATRRRGGAAARVARVARAAVVVVVVGLVLGVLLLFLVLLRLLALLFLVLGVSAWVVGLARGAVVLGVDGGGAWGTFDDAQAVEGDLVDLGRGSCDGRAHGLGVFDGDADQGKLRHVLQRTAAGQRLARGDRNLLSQARVEDADELVEIVRGFGGLDQVVDDRRNLGRRAGLHGLGDLG